MSEIGEMSHDLKCWPEYFQALVDGRKTFEVRRNDRNFAVGDWLYLREWDLKTQEYTGRSIRLKVAYITEWEQKTGYVVMGLCSDGETRETARNGTPENLRGGSFQRRVLGMSEVESFRMTMQHPAYSQSGHGDHDH